MFPVLLQTTKVDMSSDLGILAANAEILHSRSLALSVRGRTVPSSSHRDSLKFNLSETAKCDMFENKHDFRIEQPFQKKNAFQRYKPEQRRRKKNKVIVQPTHSEYQAAKRLKSEWDLLFYDNKEQNSTPVRNCFQLNSGCSASPAKKCHLPFQQAVKRNVGLLVTGREMENFFGLTSM